MLDQKAFDWQTAFAKLQTKKKSENSTSFELVPPKPFIKETTQQGKVMIGFSSDIRKVPDLQMINNGTIFLDQLMPHRNLRGKINPRNLERVRIPVLEVNVFPGLESNVSDLQFIWNVTQEDAKSMEVQLYFMTPLKISSNAVSIAP